MAKPARTNVTRLLDSRKVDYKIFTFSSDIHSAQGVSEVVGVPVETVYKSLVVMREHGKPLVVMVGGDRELSLKDVARAVGEKKVRMATMREAESLTGLKVGGISALALLSKPFELFIDEHVLEHNRVLLSAGKRGINIQLAVSDLVELTCAQVIEATRG